MGEASSILSVILSAGLGLAVGAWGGWAFGRRSRGSSRMFWFGNGAALVLGLGLSVLAAAAQFPPLSFFSIGFMGGAITGLKYGYGASEGLWRTHDVWMKSDKRLRGAGQPREGAPQEDDEDRPA